ncbi:MAG: hypothetical protein H0U74_01875 [Bradymonadaceae bacterium]|nr:hypothetical protein [Lujinxingiaceae bacterium]
MTSFPRRRAINLAVAIAVAIVLAALLTFPFRSLSNSDAQAVVPYIPERLHPVTIKTPAGIGTLRTEQRDIHGNPVGVACSTCHADSGDRPLIERSAELTVFHTDLKFAHGQLSCSSCHNPDDRDLLRLADGQKIAFVDTMQLCAQCHGTQHRSYENGAHGGMVGYWDLSKGGRERNDCVACHDPHQPAYPQVMPAPPPRDRFFNVKGH